MRGGEKAGKGFRGASSPLRTRDQTVDLEGPRPRARVHISCPVADASRQACAHKTRLQPQHRPPLHVPHPHVLTPLQKESAQAYVQEQLEWGKFWKLLQFSEKVDKLLQVGAPGCWVPASHALLTPAVARAGAPRPFLCSAHAER